MELKHHERDIIRGALERELERRFRTSTFSDHEKFEINEIIGLLGRL